MTIITRFAPSPTGDLHIGGARTALYNFLYARKLGGKFLVRVEDTDKKHKLCNGGNVDDNVRSILAELNWLGIESDEAATLQSANYARHKDVVERLLAQGQAYYCYDSVARADRDSVVYARQAAGKKNNVFRSAWRDKDKKGATQSTHKDVAPVVRLKVPLEGSITIDDSVKGEVTLSHDQIDDFVLLRSDGSPTYMLSVVVDDYDQRITHIIRGDDHFTNSFRQRALYRACCVAGIFDSAPKRAEPACAHIPLVLDENGDKLSKRKGARSIGSFRDDGILPEALVNFILRLGWGHGDGEIFSQSDAIRLFDLTGLNHSAARISYSRLESLNGHYLRNLPLADLQQRLEPFLPHGTDATQRARFLKGAEGLRKRAKSLRDIVSLGDFYFRAPSMPLADPQAREVLASSDRDVSSVLLQLRDSFASLHDSCWDSASITDLLRSTASSDGLGFAAVARPVRALCAGRMDSPDLSEVLAILGKDETLARLKNSHLGNSHL